MTKPADPQYLKRHQYPDARNLDARVEIHRRFSTNPYGWWTWVFDALLKLPEQAKILELGCGNGSLWKDNAARVPPGWDITLSDLSPGMVDAAWRNLVVVSRSFHFEEIDAQSIPYRDAMFDAVIANHMLYHVPDRPKAISEFERVLKTEGCLFATTVGDLHLAELHQLLRSAGVDHLRQSFTEPFTLENGLEQLQAYFSHVTLDRYPDSLEVTDLELLMNYVRSLIYSEDLSDSQLMRIRACFEEQLNQNGSIFLRKYSGLFEAAS
jgi:ubiquinone/menaquinone biosynthesis C-methylase UbiE